MISISNRQRAHKIDLRLLEKIAAATLAQLNITRAELGIVLVGAKEMASLNEKFLQHEGPTDVITFDYSDKVAPPGAARTAPRAVPVIIRGEIFVCIAEAERQAIVFGTDWFSELVRYIVHGILHLSGHDDLEPLARKRMKREENRLLRKLVEMQ
ncbi:MAG: rRNA maturation RNase YbeY [Limisphaerales bacterium]